MLTRLQIAKEAGISPNAAVYANSLLILRIDVESPRGLTVAELLPIQVEACLASQDWLWRRL